MHKYTDNKSILQNKTIEHTIRRKRLKVVSACNECRRKKTKCNGEKPCTGCIKSNIECKYANTIKNKTSTPTSYHHRPIIPHKTNITNNYYTTPPTTSLATPPAPPPPPPVTSVPGHGTLVQQQELYHMTHTIQSIEGRLGAIENILYTLLQQYQPKEPSSLVQPNHSFQPDSPDKLSLSSLTIKNLLNDTSSPPNKPHSYYCT